MKVTGFTFVRNALKYDYPVIEAITSVLPLCDEFVVAVGNSDDNTMDLIRSVASPKLRLIQTVWDDSLRQGGQVLALETNKALDAISQDTDWAFYIQADEVLQEAFLPVIMASMRENLDNREVEGLLFDYRHFYGSYDYVANSRKWYRREVRIIRYTPLVRSYRDAQGFRIQGRKLQVKHSGAEIFHYGWVKPPAIQQAKAESFNKMWHDDQWMKTHIQKAESFDYSGIDSLEHFTGTHPGVMLPRIEAKNWQFSHDISKKSLSWKDRVLEVIENLTGWRPFEYKNYRLMR